ncbi:alcohol dehydrogenase [Penicillium macrosclerotiorum]|uniref:alcohol dehydrogenase n=1 Tax=Penicillium macrosclerotiorum TaxID=303699 RepID=UPI0025489050|nr:alcohol dehydrogenase [Penicillium macrosclerotiorum]KAJ5666867.1 alcohol dehydrogenase [Penicillium macrosclerotiorum]
MDIPLTQIAAAIPPGGASGSFKIQINHKHPVPLPCDGEVLVKLEYSGVCHTDVHSIRGDTPMLTDVAGHEGVGTIVAGIKRGFIIELMLVYQCGWMPQFGFDGSALIYVPLTRWLYSSCLECEICAINHTACPYQQNAGALHQQVIMHCRGQRLLDLLLMSLLMGRMFRVPFSVSSATFIVQFNAQH